VRIAHLADLHLGFRQYYRTTPAGVNQREQDVADAFRAAVDGVIAAAPDAVVIAGDLFHAVRPTNRAIVVAFQQFQRLRGALPNTPIVVIAGNHETPRTSEQGSILRLYEEIGIHLVTGAPRRFAFPELDLSVLGVPEVALHAKPELLPEGPEKYQVLLLHGEVDGVIRGTQPREHTLAPEILAGQPWNYVALGHYHVQHEVAPRVWYAGALEYTSSNVWGELADEAKHGISGKGWLLADLDAGTVTRMPIPSARTVFDAPPIAADGLLASEVDRRIEEVLAAVPGGLTDAVVRVVVTDIARDVNRSLDYAAIRAFKAQALHLQLDMRAPAPSTRIGSVDASGRRLSLAEMFVVFLAKRELPAGVSRELFMEAGARHLAEVQESDAMQEEVA
jgi:exonuclease SbcD